MLDFLNISYMVSRNPSSKNAQNTTEGIRCKKQVIKQPSYNHHNHHNNQQEFHGFGTLEKVNYSNMLSSFHQTSQMLIEPDRAQPAAVI